MAPRTLVSRLIAVPCSRVCVIAIVVTLTASNLAAQVAEPLFVHQEAIAANAAQAAAGVRSEILSRVRVGIRIDGLFAAQGVAARVQLNTGEHVWVARFERLDTDSAGFRSWVGGIEGIPDSHVVFTERDGIVSGLINAVGVTYQVRTEVPGSYFLERVDVSRLGVERDPVAVLPEAVGPSLNATAAAGSDGTTIDVLMLYTPSARAARGGTAHMASLVSQIISDTNTAFARSGIASRVRLIAAVEVAMDEAPSMVSDLVAISASKEARLLRDAARADLVQLLVNSPDLSACGVAHLLTIENAADFSAHSVADIVCAAQYTPTHEMGHNLGSHHAPEDGAVGALFNYSYGFKDAVRSFRTVMAYDCPGAPCGRILNFSNPQVVHDGGATGTPWQDNARSINVAAPTVANFRLATAPPTDAPAAPHGSLQSSVVGNHVTVSWDEMPSPGSAYLLQVGTRPGAADVFNRSVYGVGSASGTVAAGTYFWRVFALNAEGASAPSPEAQFTVGAVAAPCTVPSAPRDFHVGVSGIHVTLAWTQPITGSDLVSYVVEVGSAPGLANLLVASTGSVTSVGTPAPPGLYFVRVRAQNPCGPSPPSNEQVIAVP